MKVSLNGSITDKEDAVMTAESDGLFYGAGCFETLKSYNGKYLHLDRHLHRLNDALVYLTGVSKFFISEERIRSEISELLDANGLTDAYSKIRIQVSLRGRHGYVQPDLNEPQVVTLITADEIPNNPGEAIRLASVETTVVPASCRPTHLKLSNMLHYRQAAIEAKTKGADDALMLTVREEVAETSVANIFWEKNSIVYSPSAACDILPGVTRYILLELINEMGVDVREGTFSKSDIEHASQVWICNSVKELAWVISLDGRLYPADSKFRHDLLQRFEQYKKENLA